jgi:hypothetical protein
MFEISIPVGWRVTVTNFEHLKPRGWSTKFSYYFLAMFLTSSEVRIAPLGSLDGGLVNNQPTSSRLSPSATLIALSRYSSYSSIAPCKPLTCGGS